jgi:hypothetical protein
MRTRNAFLIASLAGIAISLCFVATAGATRCPDGGISCIDCFGISNLDCSECVLHPSWYCSIGPPPTFCWYVDFCWDQRLCKSGAFSAWNDPSNDKRTGIELCGNTADGLKFVTISIDSSATVVIVDDDDCYNAHLDELYWYGGQPTLTSLSTVSFEVAGGKTVSLLTALTDDAYNYVIQNDHSCTE